MMKFEVNDKTVQIDYDKIKAKTFNIVIFFRTSITSKREIWERQLLVAANGRKQAVVEYVVYIFHIHSTLCIYYISKQI